MSDTRNFLDRLYRDCSGGLVECRSLPNTARAWATPGQSGWFAAVSQYPGRRWSGGVVGVATRQNSASGRTDICSSCWPSGVVVGPGGS